MQCRTYDVGVGSVGVGVSCATGMCYGLHEQLN